MRRIQAKIRLFFEKIKGRFEEPIPLGLTGMRAFSADVLRIYEIPDFPSYRHAIAAMIMHMGDASIMIRKKDVARKLKKAMANQIAYSIIENIRLEEKASAAEVPAQNNVRSSDGNDEPVSDQGICTAS